MDKKTLQELYLSFLRDEGYKGEVDSDGDILFKFEGRSYFILVHEDDENFHKILFPRFWALESQEEKGKALIVANSMNRQYKNGKVYLIGDLERVSASMELFLNDPNDFKILFLRTMGILQNMVNEFADEMRKTD
jgi:hypothetical protein